MTSPSQRQLLLIACVTNAFAQAVDPLIVLGTPSLKKYNYSYATEIGPDSNGDGNCEYTLTIKYSHAKDLPFGDKDTCQVGVKAPDGLDYFAFRWHYERLDYATRLATNFDHISIDWNACGHPGFGYQTPHWDMHIYHVTPEFRATQMKCDKIYGTPVCKDEQYQTGTGKGYYVFGKVAGTNQFDNLPDGYEWEMVSAVEYMGLHGGNLKADPGTPAEWLDPTMYFTSFNGAICAVEPMLPFPYALGTQDKFFETKVEYVVKTLTTLPTYWSAGFSVDEKQTTLILKGESTICQEDFAKAKLKGEPVNVEADDQTSAAVTRSTASALLAFVSLILVFFM